jgi:hypothetical protein
LGSLAYLLYILNILVRSLLIADNLVSVF